MIGIIGGSGLDNPNILEETTEKEVTTLYGKPSSPIKIGKIKNTQVAIIARHGREHTIPPTMVPNKANIDALKQLNCSHIIATTAVGSLREEIGRGDLVIIDQFIDFTRRRDVSFFEQFLPGKVVHTPMAEPFDKNLRNIMIKACENSSIKYHKTGTVVTIEGARFSTRAESKMFRILGADIINMSIAPECILANEVGIPYVALAMSTDYDCWKTDEEPVTWDDILKIFETNVNKVIKILLSAIPKIK